MTDFFLTFNRQSKQYSVTFIRDTRLHKELLEFILSQARRCPDPDKIAARRNALSLSIEAAADRARIPADVWTAMEVGRVPMSFVTDDHLAAICGALGCPHAEIRCDGQ